MDNNTYAVPMCSTRGPNGEWCEDIPGNHLHAGEHYRHDLSGTLVKWTDNQTATDLRTGSRGTGAARTDTESRG